MARKIIIVGGGALGCATAAFLANRLGNLADIIVYERDFTYARASSALSASSIRQQFSCAVNVELSRFTYEFLDQLQRRDPGIGLRPCNYLFLGTRQQAAGLRARAETARKSGLRVREYSVEELAEQFPWLCLDGVVCGTQALESEGCFDGYHLLQAYRAMAIAAGVIFERAEVQALQVTDRRVAGILLRDGHRLAADQVIVAAGAWSSRLLEPAGMECAIRPRRRTAFILSAPRMIQDLPILVDTTGIYLRREGPHYLTVVSPPKELDEDDAPLDPDLDLFERIIWPTLAARSSAFDALRIERAWAGYYDYNTFDQNGIVGATQITDLYVVAGFSGHGLMHSAGVARGMAELLTVGAYQTLDLSPLSPARIRESRPLTESAIY